MTDPFSLSGKITIVTGATRGIGRAMAIGLGRAGATVVATGRSQIALDDVVAEAREAGIDLATAVIDVSDVRSSRLTVERVLASHGRIDALVNNAGLGHASTALDVTEAQWDEMMGVNLRGVFFMSQAVARAMVSHGDGRIVNISSQAGFVGLRDAAVYCASKGGVNMMTKALAVEWAPHGIRVNAIAPTFVHTPGTAPILDDPEWRDEVVSKIPLGEIAQPADVIGAAIYLLAPASRMVTGSVLVVDGGWTAQ